MLQLFLLGNLNHSSPGAPGLVSETWETGMPINLVDERVTSELRINPLATGQCHLNLTGVISTAARNAAKGGVEKPAVAFGFVQRTALTSELGQPDRKKSCAASEVH